MPLQNHSHTALTYQRIGFISTSRADAGIYESLVDVFLNQSSNEPLYFAGGTHLAHRFGHTIEQLPKHDRVRIIPVNHHVEGDAPMDVANSAGRAVDAFSRAFAQAKPDLLFALGDRTEMLAAALAATIHRIPIAHLHGGESTAGAYDDACRHAITKLSHLHFAALPQYAARIIAMQEHPSRVYTVGALSLDRLSRFKPETPAELSAAIGINFDRPTVVVAFHVETLAFVSPHEQIHRLLAALRNIDANLIFIGTNADVGHLAIDEAVRTFVGRNPGARHIATLPTHRFWSCLAHARVLVGNSSAGIIEASSFRIPVVNVGSRQEGRIQPANIVNAPLETGAIGAAIRKALAPEFRDALQSVANPYFTGSAAENVVSVLKTLPSRDNLLRKTESLRPAN
ncbi:MAG: UDP-N-acetylglucosamine 2-epimerase (hydrolyzing) [Planctomycetes bacterium]|nr:UDP-N-acetylglucosamine 2-epimerase (hydrolyzing) [Planctomycetota bacterium]